MKRYTTRQARENFAKLLREARAGEEVVIPSRDESAVRIASMKESATKTPFARFYATLVQPIVPYGKAAAVYHAEERVRLESCRSADAQIAAISVTQDLALVTRNVRDLKAFRGIVLESWS